jgi:hypothetical protein
MPRRDPGNPPDAARLEGVLIDVALIVNLETS